MKTTAPSVSRQMLNEIKEVYSFIFNVIKSQLSVTAVNINPKRLHHTYYLFMHIKIIQLINRKTLFILNAKEGSRLYMHASLS